ncbi:unnamed protein product [Penicillium discolor]
MTILLGDCGKDTPYPLVRLTDLNVYHIECANNKTYIIPRTFFKKHNIPGYEEAKHKPYENDRDSMPSNQPSQPESPHPHHQPQSYHPPSSVTNPRSPRKE